MEKQGHGRLCWRSLLAMQFEAARKTHPQLITRAGYVPGTTLGAQTGNPSTAASNRSAQVEQGSHMVAGLQLHRAAPRVEDVPRAREIKLVEVPLPDSLGGLCNLSFLGR